LHVSGYISGNDRRSTLSTAQRKALTNHRRRRRDSGLVRVEVQAPDIDAGLIRDIAAVLRGEPEAAQAMRAKLRATVTKPRTASVFDIFGADLEDARLDDVFEVDRQRDLPRDVDF
jgi:hypothetical protein